MSGIKGEEEEHPARRRESSIMATAMRNIRMWW